MTGQYTLPALITLALLSGCSSPPATAPAKTAASAVQAQAEDVDTSQLSEPKAGLDSRCNADGVQNLVGKTVTRTLVENARDKAGARYVRITAPHEAVTLDYNGQRLNIDTSDAGAVLSLNCG